MLVQALKFKAAQTTRGLIQNSQSRGLLSEFLCLPVLNFTSQGVSASAGFNTVTIVLVKLLLLVIGYWLLVIGYWYKAIFVMLAIRPSGNG